MMGFATITTTRETDTSTFKVRRVEVAEKPRQQAPPTLRQMRTKSKKRKQR